nr:transposase, MuDR [Tanacetum cinerariifolium]
MLCEWRVRKKGQESNPYEDYRDFLSVFCLKINHGGTFTTPLKIRYKGGKVIELYTDHSVNKKHVFIQEPLVLGTTSEPNEPDIGSGSEAEVDVSQSSRNGSRSENGSGSGSSSDSGSENGSDGSSGSNSEDTDYFVDEENLIDDVDVDMAEFKSHTYPDVEWVGCKEIVVEENEVFDLQKVIH